MPGIIAIVSVSCISLVGLLRPHSSVGITTDTKEDKTNACVEKSLAENSLNQHPIENDGLKKPSFSTILKIPPPPSLSEQKISPSAIDPLAFSLKPVALEELGISQYEEIKLNVLMNNLSNQFSIIISELAETIYYDDGTIGFFIRPKKLAWEQVRNQFESDVLILLGNELAAKFFTKISGPLTAWTGGFGEVPVMIDINSATSEGLKYSFAVHSGSSIYDPTKFSLNHISLRDGETKESLQSLFLSTNSAIYSSEVIGYFLKANIPSQLSRLIE